jgi:hypothetical protein
MSSSNENSSPPAGEPSSEHFVLDFLYHDSRRIGSFLAQFEQFGLLSQVTQTNTAQESESEDKEHEGSINTGVFKGKKSGGKQANSSLSDTSQLVYDPYWSNARAFLNHLESANMIQRDLDCARIGQFVLVKGSLVVSDLQMFQNVWKSDIVRKFVKSTVTSGDDEEENVTGANRQQKRANQIQARRKAQDQAPSEADLVMELLPYLPHSSQFHLVSDDSAVWGTIEEDSMAGKIADLTLKHGPKIAGEWTMLGILDGLPFATGDLLTTMEMIRTGMTTENLSKIPLSLAPHVRQLLGRPLMSYGMTPLMVFREISG